MCTEEIRAAAYHILHLVIFSPSSTILILGAMIRAIFDIDQCDIGVK